MLGCLAAMIQSPDDEPGSGVEDEPDTDCFTQKSEAGRAQGHALPEALSLFPSPVPWSNTNTTSFHLICGVVRGMTRPGPTLPGRKPEVHLAWTILLLLVEQAVPVNPPTVVGISPTPVSWRGGTITIRGKDFPYGETTATVMFPAPRLAAIRLHVVSLSRSQLEAQPCDNVLTHRSITDPPGRCHLRLEDRSAQTSTSCPSLP